MYKHYRQFVGQPAYVELIGTLTELKSLVLITDPTTKKPLNRKHRDLLDEFIHRLFTHNQTIYDPAAHLCSHLVVNLTESGIDRFLSIMLATDRVVIIKDISLYADQRQISVGITTPSIQEPYGAEVWALMEATMRRAAIDLFLMENP